MISFERPIYAPTPFRMGFPIQSAQENAHVPPRSFQADLHTVSYPKHCTAPDPVPQCWATAPMRIFIYAHVRNTLYGNGGASSSWGVFRPRSTVTQIVLHDDRHSWARELGNWDVVSLELPSSRKFRSRLALFENRAPTVARSATMMSSRQPGDAAAIIPTNELGPFAKSCL